MFRKKHFKLLTIKNGCGFTKRLISVAAWTIGMTRWLVCQPQ